MINIVTTIIITGLLGARVFLHGALAVMFQRLSRYRDALEFYADLARYSPEADGSDAIGNDRGERARVALKKEPT